MPLHARADAILEDDGEPNGSIHIRTFLLAAPDNPLNPIEMMQTLTAEALDALTAEYQKLEAATVANGGIVPDDTPDILVATGEFANEDGQGFGLRLALNITHNDCNDLNCPVHGKAVTH